MGVGVVGLEDLMAKSHRGWGGGWGFQGGFGVVGPGCPMESPIGIGLWGPEEVWGRHGGILWGGGDPMEMSHRDWGGRLGVPGGLWGCGVRASHGKVL